MAGMQRTLSLVALLLAGCAVPATSPAQPAGDVVGTRPIVVISDLHMGLGRGADGQWDPKEDFRWTGALRGFLDKVAGTGKEQVDLVIAGDFLELWQPPSNIQCIGDGADLGCTIPEMKAIVRRVVSEHSADAAALASFAKRGTNKVYVIPGNHDAVLVIPEIWKIVADAMDAPSGRVELVASGVWVSADGKVLIEHGHQIGSDANRYRNWPTVTESKNGQEYVVRPWGELFVQRLFNAEEEQYPIIDNLSPETAGARYRMADRGLWGSTADVARFVTFNLFETSARQKGAALGREPDAGVPCTRAEADALGHRLVLGALDPKDPFRVQAEAKTKEAQLLRDELDALVKRLPDQDIQDLCARQVDASTLGAAIESKFVPRAEVIRKHLRERIVSYPSMTVFVYGHTHQLEEAWALSVKKERLVTVLNSGAFQRLIDERGYLTRVQALKPPSRPEEGLRRIPLETLAPCYGVVLVNYKDGIPKAETQLWHMPESGTGGFVSPGSSKCD